MKLLLGLCINSFFSNVLADVPECAEFGHAAWLLVEQGVFLPLTLLFLLFLLVQAVFSRALRIKVENGFLLLHLDLLRFFFDLDLLRHSPPPLSLLFQFLWSCRKMRQCMVNAAEKLHCWG